jgi:PPM family protein phosphatase
MTFAVRAAAATDQGLVRSNNEDAVFVGNRLFVVADGMGGLPAGELASEIGVRALAVVDDMPDTGEPLQDLLAALRNRGGGRRRRRPGRDGHDRHRPAALR